MLTTGNHKIQLKETLSTEARPRFPINECVQEIIWHIQIKVSISVTQQPIEHKFGRKTD